jgi:hypothetical protein
MERLPTTGEPNPSAFAGDFSLCRHRSLAPSAMIDLTSACAF